MTDSAAKCYATIGGVRSSTGRSPPFDAAGVREKVFIGGYQISIRSSATTRISPSSTTPTANNNILLSLFHAEQHMAGGFVCAYSDILFRDSVVRDAMNHPATSSSASTRAGATATSTAASIRSTTRRKVTVSGDRVTGIHRDIESPDADGEYIGVAKFSPRGRRFS
jgi:choline kinase